MKLSNKIFLFLFFTLVLALLPNITAATGEELLLDNYFFSGDVFFVDDIDYVVSLPTSREKIALQDPNGQYLVVDYNECETVEYIKFCFDTTLFDDAHDDYKAKIQVYRLEPVITVTQSADDTSPRLDDIIEISVVIDNNGDVDAPSFVFEQVLLDGFEFVSGSVGVEETNGIITWESDILSDSQKDFSYVLRAVKSDSYTLTAECNYYDGAEYSTVFSNDLAVTVGAPATLEITTNSTTVGVGGIIDAAFKITNEESETIDLNLFRIKVPSSFIVEDYDSRVTLASEGSNEYRYIGKLAKNSSIEFDFELRSIYDSVTNLASDLIVTKDGVQTSIEKNLKVTSTMPEIVIRPYFRPEVIYPSESIVVIPENDKMTMESMQTGRFELYLDNPSNYFSIQNIVFNANSELFFKNVAITDPILKKSSRRVLYFNFTTPEVSSTKNYDVVYTIKFDTEYGYTYEEEIEQTISVIPVKDLTVKHEYSISKPEGGDNIKVTVTVKNERDVAVNDVQVQEILPDELSPKGVTSTKINIDEDETVTAYEYYIQLPIVSETTEYELLTSIMYKDGSNMYRYNTSDDFDVKKRSPDITLKKSVISKTVNRGSIVDIDYEIDNDDAFRAEDIVIYFPGLEETYLVDDLFYELDSLDPSQTKTLTGIEKRVFLHYIPSGDSESISVPDSVFRYVDDFGETYFDDASKLTFKVEEGTVVLPLVSITKDVTDYDKDSVSYDVTLENYGTTSATIILVNIDDEFEITLAPNETITKSFEESSDIIISNNYMVPASHFYFEQDGSTYYGVSEEIDIDVDAEYYIPDVVEEIVEIEDPEDIEDVETDVNNSEDTSDTETENDDIPVEPEKESQSLWQKIISFFKRLFGGSD